MSSKYEISFTFLDRQLYINP